MIWLVWLSLALGVAASAEDLWRRRVSNALSAGGFLAGTAAHAALAGWSGVGDALLGGLIGFAAFFVFFLAGGMGGGDVKLMAAFGAILGRDQVITAVVMTALVGGLLALGFLVWKKARRAVRKQVPAEGKPDRKDFIPYAPAIALGVLLSFLSEDELWTSVC